MKTLALSLWLALDAIVELANQTPTWAGDENQLVDEICRLTGTTITKARRKWLVNELSTDEVRDILTRRGVTFWLKGGNDE